jgi:hypothetical protein
MALAEGARAWYVPESEGLGIVPEVEDLIMRNRSVAIILGFDAQHAEVNQREDVGEDLPRFQRFYGCECERDRDGEEGGRIKTDGKRADLSYAASLR